MNPLQSFFQRVARTAVGGDRIDVGADVAQLRPQVLDVRVDRAVQAGLGRVPDQLQELVAAVDPAGALEQDGEELVLVARQLEGLAEVGDLVALLVEPEGAPGRGWWRGAAAGPG